MGAGQPPGAGALPPSRRETAAGASPRGQALQGKQKSVVNAVPNPKWLLPNCNPIKVRLVYLSSSGLFITVQMAATFGRLSSSLPAARHAQLSSTESGPAPVRGREWRPQGTRGLVSLPPGLTNPSLCRLAADGAGSRQCCHTWCRAPRLQVLLGDRKAARSPTGGQGAVGAVGWYPMPSTTQLRTRGTTGCHWQCRLEEKAWEDQGHGMQKRQPPAASPPACRGLAQGIRSCLKTTGG